MHIAVKEKLERFNTLFIKSANGRLSPDELVEFLELRDALRRIGRDVKELVKVP